MGKELLGLKILVVDDDQDTLELLEWVLKRSGAQVTAVSSAKLQCSLGAGAPP